MTDYICLACNHNCIHDESKMREMGILQATYGKDEIWDIMCPCWGEMTQFQEYNKGVDD